MQKPINEFNTKNRDLHLPYLRSLHYLSWFQILFRCVEKKIILVEITAMLMNNVYL